MFRKFEQKMKQGNKDKGRNHKYHENIAENWETAVKDDNREYNSFQNWSTHAPMHILNVLV